MNRAARSVSQQIAAHTVKANGTAAGPGVERPLEVVTLNAPARRIHLGVLRYVPHGDASAGSVGIQVRLNISRTDRAARGAENGITAQLRDFDTSAACFHVHAGLMRDPDVKADPEMMGKLELVAAVERHLHAACGFAKAQLE